MLAGSDVGDTLEYNPNLLDDPQWPCGKHKRVLIFASYMVSCLSACQPALSAPSLPYPPILSRAHTALPVYADHSH